MDRINTPTKQANLFGAGKHGFRDGDNNAGISPTDLDAAWFNDLQEELLAIIEGVGIAPAAGQRTQVYQAIQLLIANATKDYKASVRFTTTGNIALAGLGTQVGGDWGVALTAGDRIFPKDQTTGSQNGIYIANAGAWTRATDFDASSEVSAGMVVAVEEGVTLADTQWMLTTNDPIILGTTALVFSRKDASPAVVGFRNRIINGSMAIDQRNAGASQSFTAAAALAYCVDRWYGYCTGGNVTGQRVVGSGTSMFRYQFTGAASVTKIGFAQRIERANSIDLAGNTATLSVDLANSLLTTVNWTAWYANTNDTFGTLASPTRTQIATGSFTVTNSLARYSTAIAIPAGATTGIEVEFSVGAQTSGSWTIGEVQLEPGTTQTVMERRPPNVELAACQRFFQKLGFTLYGSFPDVSSPSYAIWMFKTDMRVTPTLNFVGLTGSLATSGPDGLTVVISNASAVIGSGSTATAEL